MKLGERPRSLVTGVAGFIGSHVAERLLQEGHEVMGVDCFSDYYPRWIKETNLKVLLHHPRFTFQEGDLLTMNLGKALEGVDYIFHEAAQPGVRGSWGEGFRPYLENNVTATQRLLEAAKGSRTLKRLVYASSSSIYGNAPELPLHEEARPRPFSPYGVTKLAAEHLCLLYYENEGLPTTALRYFTVYGPRQRPDMAFHRFLLALLEGREIIVFGDGEQTRDFTYILDAVEATLLALRDEATGKVFNVGGGARITVNTVIRLLEGIVGRKAVIRYEGGQKGEMRHTYADISLASKVLGFSPQIPLEEGLKAEADWIKEAFFR